MWVFDLLFPARNSGEQAAQIREIFENLQNQIPILYSTAIIALIGICIATGGADLKGALPAIPLIAILVRRQNIWHRSRRKLAECGPRLLLGFRRRAYGVASADVQWSVA